MIERRVNELEDDAIEMIQSEQQKEEIKKRTEPQGPVGQWQKSHAMYPSVRVKRKNVVMKTR